MNLAQFEQFVLTQKSTLEEDYSQEYFKGDWRDDKMSYDVASRRVIEGRNPENIINFLNPKRALDVGCGPGALISLLAENGFNNCWGVDISAQAIEMAEDLIKSRLVVGSAWETSFSNLEFDLVICREVLEHLTVRQIFNTVREMCRVSSDKVYVTTRFHPNPSSLLDVTTEFEEDPTHISCLNIDLLRVFFVLNGFVRDCELEDKIDWMNKKRVLVYRRAEH